MLWAQDSWLRELSVSILCLRGYQPNYWYTGQQMFSQVTHLILYCLLQTVGTFHITENIESQECL